MSRINVLMVSDHISYNEHIHGVGMFFFNILPHINKDNFRTVLCVLRRKDSSDDLFKTQGISIQYLGMSKFDPRTLNSLIKIIKKEKIDILHLHGYGASSFGILAALLTRTPVIVHSHDNNTNYPLYQRFADIFLTRYADKVIAVSGSVKESSIRKRRFNESNIIVMHNAIPLEKFQELDSIHIEEEKKRLGIDPVYKVIGTVTRLREEKGNEYFLEAAAEVLKLFPETVFLIVGEGPLRAELQIYCKKLNIEKNVIFYGFSKEVTKQYSIFDINVISSLTEGSPGALFEAMAMGKAIISTNAGGIKEIITDGKTGLLVPSGNSIEIAKKIIFLLRNEKERKKLGQFAREESKKYDIETYVKRLENIYIMFRNEKR